VAGSIQDAFNQAAERDPGLQRAVAEAKRNQARDRRMEREEHERHVEMVAHVDKIMVESMRRVLPVAMALREMGVRFVQPGDEE
jgi:hypothetical protein